MNFDQYLEYLFGLLGLPLVEFIKRRYNLEGKAAAWVWVGASVVLAIGALFAAGDVSLSDFTWAAFQPAFGKVLAASFVAYKLFLKE